MDTARNALISALGLTLLLGACALSALAAPPALSEIPGAELQEIYQAGKTYTLRLQYTDPDGDRPRKAQFIDESPAGTVSKDLTRLDGNNFRGGVPLVWEVRGFEPGAHRAYFLVTDAEGQTTRFPPSPDQFYTFKVESLGTKWGIMAAGLVVGLLFVPFLVYVLARSLNRRGDPSRAARVGLLFGILACCALFIYLFASFYGPLAYAIGGIAALALLVIVLTRR